MNLFLIPRSPITQLTVHTGDVPQGNGLPSFQGYGNRGALNRFKVPVFESFRDIGKRHPCSVGSKSGFNVHITGGKAMDISAKFVGNFIIAGTVNDANSTAITNSPCTLR